MGYWIERKTFSDVVVEQSIEMGKGIIRGRKYYIVKNGKDIIQKVKTMCEKHDLFCLVSPYETITCKPKEFPSVYALYNYIDKKFNNSSFSFKRVGDYGLIKLPNGKKLTYRISK